jgi:hypothetical protein
MYDEIYQNLYNAGLACKHPEPLWRDETVKWWKSTKHMG